MVREMAALLLGRLLTRPDMGPALSQFLEWQRGALAAAGARQPARLEGGREGGRGEGLAARRA